MIIKKLGESWKRARASVLADLYAELVARRIGMPAEPSAEFAWQVGQSYYVIMGQYDYLANMPLEDRKNTAEELKKLSIQIFPTNYGGSHGLSLMSIWLESSILPGEEAAEVHHEASLMVHETLETYAQLLTLYTESKKSCIDEGDSSSPVVPEGL